MLAGGTQLQLRPLGEAVHAHAVEHVVRCAQLVACLPPPTLAA
jgi:hypothetical protein